MSWQERAKCDGLDTEIFFPGTIPGDDAQAIEVCERCPVRRQCLELALRTDRTYRYGIFGGYGPKQRARIARKLARKRAEQVAAVEVDEAAVLRRVDGDLVPLNLSERAEVIRRLRAKGLPDNEIGRRTRMKVERYAPPRRQLQEAS